MGDSLIWTHTILGVVQGLTELLPVSSSGHLILTHAWLGVTGNDLAFDALLHFATALAIAVYFWKDIKILIEAAVSVVPTARAHIPLNGAHMLVIAIATATIPAVILGLLLEDIMGTLFRSPHLVAWALIIGSVVMIIAEWYSRMPADRPLPVDDPMTWQKGLTVGLFQSLALVPGMSRSGMSIAGGMLVGLDRAAAARFGFLIGIPLLLGAGAKKVLEIGVTGMSSSMLLGAFMASIVALLVIHYLLAFLRKNPLTIFIVYRIILAVGILILL